MSPRPTGRLEDREFGEAVVLERSFRAPVDDVWAAVTEPARLQRWIGTWTGDPTSGEVVFRMTAEGEDAGPEPVTIHECSPPHRLRATVRTDGDDAEWHWDLSLAQTGDVTTLTFAQSTAGGVPVDSVGPGWEYYLDRLAADMSDQDVAAVDWDRHYYPAMQQYYRDLRR
ncbi:SRPBCC domain-containing protein [Jannaschia sp. R86511]|uniref:SRPBCC domain-containing protein n=1 Tax=Jannaschia sp. R86511 TaxID=3093853 RepID=UPI0036D2DFA6